MNLDTYLAGIDDGCHVRCYDGGDTGFFCSIKRLPHVFEVFVVEDYVEGEIGLDSCLGADSDYLSKVFHLEIVCGV